MRPLLRYLRFKGVRPWIYSAGFFLTLGYTIPWYTNSRFLADYVGEERVGLIFSLASIIAIAVSLWMTGWLRTHSLTQSIKRLSWITLVALLILGLEAPAPIILLAFLTYYLTTILLRIQIDTYLESYSDNQHTGVIRGIFFTVVNLAWVISPLLASLVAERFGGWSAVYILTAAAFIPFILLTHTRFNHRADGHPRERNTLRSILRLLIQTATGRIQDIKRILLVDFILNFFFSFMVVYMPIYLAQHIGLRDVDIGLIFSIMLLPYLILEWPLGWLADRFFGEKEILSWGLIITAIFTFTIPFISSANPLVWAAVLVMTRVGASAVEMMKETYFFKNTDAGDTYLLSLSRNMAPLAYLIGPIVATVFLLFLPLQFIFLIPGLALLWGLRPALAIKDTA